MYEDKKMEFDWKGFLLKLAFVIIVIVLVIKLLPLNNKKEINLTKSEEFKSNMNKLKDAGNDYFTIDKLPSSVEETVQVSLNDLIKVGAIRTLRDTEGESCDENSSYIKAKKNENDYSLELYLVCGEEEETSFVYLNCTNLGSETTTTTTKVSNNNTTKKSNYSSGESNSSSSNANYNKNNVSYVTSKVINSTTTSNKVTVIFNSNGGSSISAQSVIKGRTAIRPNNPIKNGYTFIGWYNNENIYSFNETVNNNIILVAKWQANNNTTTKTTNRTTTYYYTPTSSKNTTNRVRYTVSFNSNGGSYISAKSVYSGNTISAPSNPYKSNSVFIGWYWNNEPFNFNSRIYGNIILVAKYRETRTTTKDVYSSAWSTKVSYIKVAHTLAIPSDLKVYENVRIKSVNFIRTLSSQADLYNYEKFHSSTFEYKPVNADYTSGNALNFANISYANIYKTSSSIYNRQLAWEGNVSSQCQVSFNYLNVTNACLYGILYRVNWEYEVVN